MMKLSLLFFSSLLFSSLLFSFPFSFSKFFFFFFFSFSLFLFFSFSLFLFFSLDPFLPIVNSRLSPQKTPNKSKQLLQKPNIIILESKQWHKTLKDKIKHKKRNLHKEKGSTNQAQNKKKNNKKTHPPPQKNKPKNQTSSPFQE